MPDFWTYSGEDRIRGKIAAAAEMMEKYGERLLACAGIVPSLERLRHEISETQRLMRDMGVVEDCAACAGRPGGGCCGAGIEDWFDEVVLLMNLLLGRAIPSVRSEREGCLFLGPRGCLLLARNYFCVNYLCHHITSRLCRSDLAALEAQAGKEIFASWQVEKELQRRIALFQRGGNHTPLTFPVPPGM